MSQRVEDQAADHCADEPDDDISHKAQAGSAHDQARQQARNQADHQPHDDVMPIDPGKRDDTHKDLLEGNFPDYSLLPER